MKEAEMKTKRTHQCQSYDGPSDRDACHEEAVAMIAVRCTHADRGLVAWPVCRQHLDDEFYRAVMVADLV